MVTELVEWFFGFFTLPKKEVPNSLVMTLPRWGTMRTSGHIFLAASAATVAFRCPTWCFLNRNCLLRLLFSIVSISVMCTMPPDPHPSPIIAQFLSISQLGASESDKVDNSQYFC